MIRVTDKQYWMNPTLKTNLDSLVHNAKDDWNPIIVISGKSKTRIGKTVLATQIAYYMAYRLKRSFTVDNILFSGMDLIEQAKNMSPGVFVLDESRADLATSKRLNESTQHLIDFFNETGMLNNIVILVIPDFFDLMKQMAVGHSEILINCFAGKSIVKNDEGNDVQKKVRGYYGFYNDDRKRLLYFKGKKHDLDYGCVKWNFWGNFMDFWVVDKQAYEDKKLMFINRSRQENPKEGNKYLLQRNALIEYLCLEANYTHEKVAKILVEKGFNIERRAISSVLAKRKKEKRVLEYHDMVSVDDVGIEE